MDYPQPDRRLFLGSRANGDGRAWFRIWAPLAETVRLLCWRRSWIVAGAAGPDWVEELRPDPATGCWDCDFLPERRGLGLPLFYQYEIVRAGVSCLAADPWAWAADAHDGLGSPRSCLLPPAVWSEWTPTPVADGGWYRHPAQAVVCEAHVRDLSAAADSAVPMVYRGLYFGAVGALDRIAALGATHLQLQPLQLFGRSDETERGYEDASDPAGNNYNWGYDPVSYFAPSAWYARDPADPASRVRDLRLLVGEAHARGLRVVVDVVYNHQYRTETLEQIAPGYWFRLDGEGRYRNNSGCGNDLESVRPMFRRLMAESLAHWIEQYDVDGFRFDLMGLADRQTMREVRDACRARKGDVLLIGEGWRMYDGPPGTLGMDQAAMAEEEGFAVFNDEFRDALKGGGMDEGRLGFLHGAPVDTRWLAANLLGRPKRNYRSRHHWQNVQYLECHDGLTLRDNLAWNLERVEGAPPAEAELLRRCAAGNLMLALARGICFLQAGQEAGRSKPAPADTPGLELCGAYVRNSYRAGDAVNALPWRLDEGRRWLREWTRGALELRRSHPLFRARWDEPDPRRWHFWGQGRAGLLAWTVAGGDAAALVACNVGREARRLKLPPALAARLSGADGAAAPRCLADRHFCGPGGVDAPQGFAWRDGDLWLDGLCCAILTIETKISIP